jgi:hypothetical protein
MDRILALGDRELDDELAALGIDAKADGARGRAMGAMAAETAAAKRRRAVEPIGTTSRAPRRPIARRWMGRATSTQRGMDERTCNGNGALRKRLSARSAGETWMRMGGAEASSTRRMRIGAKASASPRGPSPRGALHSTR